MKRRTIAACFCVMLSFTACSKEVSPKLNKNSSPVANVTVPQYDFKEYDFSDRISEVRNIYSDKDNFYVSGHFADNTIEIIKKDIKTDSVLTSLSIQSMMDPDGDGCFYVNDSYYDGGIRYNSDGQNDNLCNAGLDIIKICAIDEENAAVLMRDAERQYYIAVLDAANNIVSRSKLDLPERHIVKDISFYDGKYYAATIQVEIIGEQKTYLSSIFELNDRFEVLCEISDFDIDSVDGIVNVDSENIVVYCYDEEEDTTSMSVSDGDMSTFSDIKKLEGKVRMFPSEKSGQVYITGQTEIFTYDLKTDKLEAIKAIDDDENKAYWVIACDDTSYVYVQQDMQDPIKKIKITGDFDISDSDDVENEYDCIETDEGLAAVCNIYNGNEIVFPEFASENYITYYNGMFWGIGSSGKVEVYGDDGNLKFTCDDKDYRAEKIFLSGDCPSLIYSVDNNFYFSFIDPSDGSFKNKIKISDSEFINKAYSLYCGDEKYLFYVYYEGYIYGFGIDEKQFDVLLDLAYLNSPPVIGIKNISDGVYQLVTEDKVYKASVRTSDSPSVPEIILGNLTGKSLNPYLSKFPENFDEYIIKVVDYSENADIYTALNQDILSGNQPDIIISDSYIDVSYLERKNFFAELDETLIFDKDKEYLDNVIRLFRTGDSLYKVPDGFRIDTMITDDRSLTENWSYERMLGLIKSGQENLLDREHMFSQIVPYFEPDFMNSSNLELNFNSDLFREIIRTSGEFTLRNEEIGFTEDYEEQDYLLYNRLLGTEPNDYRIKKESCICGYPSINGGRSYIYPQINFSVSAQSEYKEECIDFIKRSMADPNEFPLEVSGFMEDMNVLKMSIDSDFVDELQELVINSDSIELARNIPSVNNIIAEEYTEYLEGTRSVDSMVENTENKIKLYLNEIR